MLMTNIKPNKEEENKYINTNKNFRTIRIFYFQK